MAIDLSLTLACAFLATSHKCTVFTGLKYLEQVVHIESKFDIFEEAFYFALGRRTEMFGSFSFDGYML